MRSLFIPILFCAPMLAQTEQATLVFFRSPNTSLEVRYHVPGFLDNSQVANLKANQYCSIEVHPGKHTVRSKDKNRAVILHAEPGKMYYIRVELRHGSFGLSNVWLATLIDPQQGERDIAGYDKLTSGTDCKPSPQ